MKIGVFDSGVGGRSVANAIQKALPEYTVQYAQDEENVPYGLKSPEILLRLVVPILQGLVQDKCDVIVVACNSVTTTIIEDLRKIIPVPLIGVEPMIQPAVAITRSKIVAVCATPTTLASKRYEELKETYAHPSHVQVIEPDCSRWADMIEKNRIDQALIEDVTEECIQRGADVIVMGCTHYHWIEKIVERKALGRAIVLQPEAHVIVELKQVIAQLG